ncbi:MAG: hypothetical protein WAM97_16380 [Acidimicrobiales bacterium]
MEPINYGRALRRRWPLIVGLGVVCAVVGVLIPIKAPYPPVKSQWQATALAGLPPKDATGSQTVEQVEYYAEVEQVFTNTAKAMHLKKDQGASLRHDIQIKHKASLPTGSLNILAKQPTKAGAAKLANEFVKQLAAYIQSQLTQQYNKALASATSSVNSLSSQIASVQTQINQQTKATTPKTTTTTAAPTTTTTVAKTTTTTAAPTTTTTVAKTTTTTAKKTLPATTTTTAATQSTPTTEAPTGAVETVHLVSLDKPAKTAKTTTPTTAKKAPTATTVASQAEILQQKLTTLKQEYSAATSKLTKLQTQGPPTNEFGILLAARTSNEKFLPATTNPFDRRSIRGLAGFIAGLVVGIIVAFGLDAFDKRLRTTSRTAVAFGLPVIAEIPKEIQPGGKNAPRTRRGRRKSAAASDLPFAIAVFDWPASVVAEAYRRLRISVMFAPVRSGNSSVAAPASQNGTSGGFSSDALRSVGPEGGIPVVSSSDGNKEPDHNQADAKRDVIMVTCATTEPTNAKVVLNLAASYAEAGERVLIVSTTNLRSGAQFAPLADPSWTPPPTETVHVSTLQTQQAPENPTQPIPTISPSPTAVKVHDGPRGSDARGFTAEEVAARCVPHRVSGVSRLDLGALLRGPGELATKGDAVIRTAREIADVVIVEAPSMLGATDAEALTRSVDAILVVAQSYNTTVGNARRTAELLRRVAAPTLGVVLTEVLMTAKQRRILSPEVPSKTK